MSINRPPYNIFPKLESESIIMREVISTDFADILTITTYDGILAKSTQDVEKIYNKINNDYQHGNSISWGITTKNNNEIIGTCGYYRGFDKETGELGFILKEEYRAKGYMSQAVKNVVEFGLIVIQLKRIIAITSDTNFNTIKLLERLNFVKVSVDDFNRPIYEFKS